MNLVETRSRAPQAPPLGHGRRPRNPTASRADREARADRSRLDARLRRAAAPPGPALSSAASRQARFRDADRSLDTFDFDFNKKMNRALIYELATGALRRAARGRALSRPARHRQEPSRPGHRPRRDPAGLPRPLSRGAHALEELADATLDGTRKEYLADLATVPLLIIDDLGMRKLPHTAAEDLLELIMRRYERASTLLTSNRPVDDWGKLLGDTAAVTALLDRLLHHAHVLKCGPRSWRTKVQTDLRTRSRGIELTSLGRSPDGRF